MKRYAIVIEKGVTNYGDVPDLPGCVATGPTVQETENSRVKRLLCTCRGCKKTVFPFPSRPASWNM